MSPPSSSVCKYVHTLLVGGVALGNKEGSCVSTGGGRIPAESAGPRWTNFSPLSISPSTCSILFSRALFSPFAPFSALTKQKRVLSRDRLTCKHDRLCTTVGVSTSLRRKRRPACVLYMRHDLHHAMPPRGEVKIIVTKKLIRDFRLSRWVVVVGNEDGTPRVPVLVLYSPPDDDYKYWQRQRQQHRFVKFLPSL